MPSALDKRKLLSRVPVVGGPILSVVDSALAGIHWLQDNMVTILTVIGVSVATIVTGLLLLIWCLFWTVVTMGLVHRYIMSGAPESTTVPVNLDLSASCNGRMGSGLEFQHWYERTLLSQDLLAQERWNTTSAYLGKNPEVANLLAEALRARTIGQMFSGSSRNDPQEEWSSRNLFPALMAGKGVLGSGSPFYSSSLAKGSIFFKRPILEEEEDMPLWEDQDKTSRTTLEDGDDVFDGFPQKKHQSSSSSERSGRTSFSSDFPSDVVLPIDFEIPTGTVARYTMSLQLGLADDDHNEEVGPITAVGELFSHHKGGARNKVYRTVARGHSSRRVKQRSWLRRFMWDTATFWIPSWALTLLVAPGSASGSTAGGRGSASEWSDCYLDFPIFSNLRPSHFLRNRLVGMNISLVASKPVLETLHIDEAWLFIEVELEGLPWWFLHHPVLMHLILGCFLLGTIFTCSLLTIVLVVCLVVYAMKTESTGATNDGTRRGATINYPGTAGRGYGPPSTRRGGAAPPNSRSAEADGGSVFATPGDPQPRHEPVTDSRDEGPLEEELEEDPATNEPAAVSVSGKLPKKHKQGKKKTE